MRGTMRAYRVTKFTCGHVGRTNEAPRRVTAFIRVAHVGGSPLEESGKKCPDCSKGTSR